MEHLVSRGVGGRARESSVKGWLWKPGEGWGRGVRVDDFGCFINRLREFPGSPVVRTPHFPCRGHRFSPWTGN